MSEFRVHQSERSPLPRRRLGMSASPMETPCSKRDDRGSNDCISEKALRVHLLAALMLVGMFAICLAPIRAYADDFLGGNGAVADFDLSQPIDQKKVITLEDGTTAELGARYIAGIAPQWDSYYKNASGDWEIYYNSPFVERRFYITISNHKIVKAHSPSYTTFLCTVTSEDFSSSPTVVTYRLGVSTFDLASTVAVLQAIMEGTTLHTYAN